jgi:hypothetical protein
MESLTEDQLLEKCRARIEAQLEWGSSDKWTSQDYHLLSEKIKEATHVTLSVATLKRIWGKVRYESKPTITTLNTLAHYLGYENWRGFRLNYAASENKLTSPLIDQNQLLIKQSPKKRNKIGVLAAMASLIVVALSFLYAGINKKEKGEHDYSQFTFSSRKMVNEGLPNSVVFDYDASAALPDDSVFIQQSWDERLTSLVTRDQHQHTSIYYHPGYFEAKLKINDLVVKEQRIHIKTNGWLPIVDQKPVPVYFKEKDIRHNGILHLPIDKIEQFHIPLQPESPWTGYYYVNDVGEIYSDDFIFASKVKNDYGEGSNACQHTEIHLLFQGASLVIPLSAKGCISELTFEGKSGKTLDLSMFGVEFTNWINVRAEVKGKTGQLSINDKKILDFQTSLNHLRIVGMAFRFKGTGSVKNIILSRNNNEIVFQEANF